MDGCTKGSRSLPYDTGYVFLFFLIMLALEFYPLGKSADRMFWKHTKEVLDFHGCQRQDGGENQGADKEAGRGRRPVNGPTVWSFLDWICCSYFSVSR